jgi:hypothetical protein
LASCLESLRHVLEGDAVFLHLPEHVWRPYDAVVVVLRQLLVIVVAKLWRELPVLQHDLVEYVLGDEWHS